MTCFGKSVKVLTRDFSTFAIESLKNKTYNAVGKLNFIFWSFHGLTFHMYHNHYL